jgi:hypothetical protein
VFERGDSPDGKIEAQVEKELPSIQILAFTRRRKWQIFADGFTRLP